MGRTSDYLFLNPRQLFSGERIEVIDAVNLVLYARIPLVEVRTGQDLVAGFIGRQNPDVDTFLSESHRDEILDKYRESIAPLKFPVTPSQYQSLLEEMFECGEDVLPYFYHEYHQLADRRQRVASFGRIYGELASEFDSKVLILQQSESELSSICALGDWMTPTTLHAYLERRGVAPWWESERNSASHVRLERIGLSCWSNFEGFPYPGGYDPQNLPSFVFANTLFKRFHPRGGYASNVTRVPAVDSGSAERRSPEQPKPSKKPAVTGHPQALSGLSEDETGCREIRLPADHSLSQSQEVDRSFRDGQTLDTAKSSILQNSSQPEILQAMPPVNDEGVLTKKDVAKLLGVSPNTVDNYRKRLDFPEPIKYGPNTIRWERSAIVEWKDAQK